MPTPLRIAPLFLLATACGVEEPGVTGADVDGQSRVYCDGPSCINITPGNGYTAAQTAGGVVVVKRAAVVVMKYDIDGSSLPAGPWADQSWRTVDCQGDTVGLFATGPGASVLTLSDTAFVVIDIGGPVASTVTSVDEIHAEEFYMEEPPQ